MWSFLSAALSAFPSAATSHLALTAYALAVLAYIVTIWRVTRNRNLLHNLQRLPPKDRLTALEIEMGGVRLAAGISPEQWLRSKIHRYYFLSFVITCLVGIVVFVVAIVHSRGSLDISTDINRGLNPFKDVRVSFSLSYPFDHPPALARYRRRLQGEVIDLLRDIRPETTVQDVSGNMVERS